MSDFFGWVGRFFYPGNKFLWRLPTKDEVSNLLSNDYTTRSWFGGTGPEKGWRVEFLVDKVKTGQELWLSLASFRDPDGITRRDANSYPSQGGYYWTSATSGDNARFLQIANTIKLGQPAADTKLLAMSVRCVRSIVLYE